MSNIDKFLNTLPIMLQGMLGIFVVMVVIFLTILVLNRVTGRAKGGAEQDGSAASASNNN